MLIIPKRLHIPKNDYNTHNEYIENSSYRICLDKKITFKIIDDCIYILFGFPFNRYGRIDLNKILHSGEEILKTAGGGYALILIKENNISVIKSIYRNIDIYYHIHSDGYLII